MYNQREFMTEDFARSIYYQLAERDSGKIPYQQVQISFTATKRNEESLPSQAAVNVTENGREIDSFTLDFNDNYSDYSIK